MTLLLPCRCTTPIQQTKHPTTGENLIIIRIIISDANHVKATNQFAFPVLTYPMWMQYWPLAELREIDRETMKLVSENGGNHPLSSTAVFYLPRVAGGRGMKSVEHEYKVIKIKVAIKHVHR